MYVWGYMGTAVNMDAVILGCRYAEIEGYEEIVICKIGTRGIGYKDFGRFLYPYIPITTISLSPYALIYIYIP